MSTPDTLRLQKLVYMANQIGKFFTAQDKDAAAAKIAEHLMQILGPAHAPRHRRASRRRRRGA